MYLSSFLIYINFFVYYFYLQDIIYDSEINDIILLIIKTADMHKLQSMYIA